MEPSDEIGEEEVVQTPANPREETLSVLGKMCLNNEVSVFLSIVLVHYYSFLSVLHLLIKIVLGVGTISPIFGPNCRFYDTKLF